MAVLLTAPDVHAQPRAEQLAFAFEDVSKRYRSGALALDDASWTVRVGARTCLLGPNGAGKSTSIRLLEGAIRPTAGRVTLLDARVGGPEYAAARRRTGIVPQAPGMYPDLSVREYLDLARRLYGRGDVGRMLDVFELGPQRDIMLARLSGGYQRRVALAAALIAEPELLLLDEPTVGLDPVAAHDVLAYLDTAMRGRTTLLCTHNLTEAEALCDEVVILKAGRVLVQESLEVLRRRAQPALRLAARQGQQALLDALAPLDVDARAEPHGGQGVLVGTDDPEGDAPRLLRRLLRDGLDVYECWPLRASLQRLFLDIVREAA